jgi:hypothetical protein
MPLVETRELRFGQLSLRFALAHGGQATEKLGLPKGVPTSVRFLPDSQEVVASFGAAEHRLDAAALGAALLTYCLRARIPLSRRAAKSVRVLAEAVTLVARLEHEMPPEPAPERPAAAKPEAPRQMVWGR